MKMEKKKSGNHWNRVTASSLPQPSTGQLVHPTMVPVLPCSLSCHGFCPTVAQVPPQFLMALWPGCCSLSFSLPTTLHAGKHRAGCRALSDCPSVVFWDAMTKRYQHFEGRSEKELEGATSPTWEHEGYRRLLRVLSGTSVVFWSQRPTVGLSEISWKGFGLFYFSLGSCSWWKYSLDSDSRLVIFFWVFINVFVGHRESLLQNTAWTL